MRQMLTTKDVARRLNMSLRQVQKMVLGGAIPAYRFGAREFRIPEDEFQQWLEARRMPSESQREESHSQLRASVANLAKSPPRAALSSDQPAVPARPTAASKVAKRPKAGIATQLVKQLIRDGKIK